MAGLFKRQEEPVLIDEMFKLAPVVNELGVVARHDAVQFQFISQCHSFDGAEIALLEFVTLNLIYSLLAVIFEVESED